MLSPAARNRQKVLAALAAANAASGTPAGKAAARPETGPEASAYELLLAALGADLARLKEIQSIEAKIALKAQLVAAYDHHVDATLAASARHGAAVEDEIVATMLLWRLDIGDYERALDLAAHVLRFGLAMPRHMQRKAPVVVAEEVAEAALKADKTDQTFDLDVLDRTIALTADHDMPDQVRAKLYKARGRILIRTATEASQSESAPAGAVAAARAGALQALQRAYELDRKCGVQKDIERLQTKVSAAQE